MGNYCTNCGASLKPSFKFCVECGAPAAVIKKDSDINYMEKLRQVECFLNLLGCSISWSELFAISGKTVSEVSKIKTEEVVQSILSKQLNINLPVEYDFSDISNNGSVIQENTKSSKLREGERLLLHMEYEEALDWYKKYIESEGDKSGFSYNVIGKIYLYFANTFSIDSEKNNREAIVWISKAVECENVLGELNMGKLYEEGVGVEKNSSEAIRYYLRAYKHGSPYASENLNKFLDDNLNLIEIYENGCRLENVSDYDYKYLVRKYEDEAGDSNVNMLLKLGYMYQYGLGKEKSLTKARDIYLKITSLDNKSSEEYSYALCFLGDIYQEGSDAIPKDQYKAFDYWQKSSNENNKIGLFRMGQAYDYGWGITEDKDKAIENYTSSDIANAWCNLGLICKLDNVINNYVDKVLHQNLYNDDAEYMCFKKSSDMGSLEGTNCYALIHLKGWAEKKWEKDPKMAFKIISQAAELGYTSSLYILGEMYEGGIGCEKNTATALKYYRKSEKAGSPNAKDKIKALGGSQQKSVISSEEAYERLQKLIGLNNVKKEIDEVINEAKIIKEMRDKGLPESRGAYHMVFTGNPGTGKTEVARLVAAIFHDNGILSQGQLVEVDRSKLVASYVGQTTAKTQDVISSAIGGVLFIDEAYSLYKESENDYGQEAIDTILKEMEDHRDDLMVIVAGYEKPMYEFLHSNPGLESRFRRTIHFDDYDTNELLQIFKKFCSDNSNIMDEAVEESILQIIKKMVYFKTDNFGNAREIRKLYEDIIRNQRNRLSKNGNDHTKEELLTIKTDDIPEGLKDLDLDIGSIMKELDGLIGLDKVKEEIRDLAGLIQIQNYRRELGIDSQSLPSLHMVFTGNPGTGKTTVARLVAKIYKALGVLSKGSLTETSRVDLVAGYTGQTAIKTKAVIEKSLGGVLFIDEAYSLKQNDSDTFGREAIDTLLKEMEDHRNNLAVIVAGYSNEMLDFIATNEGLASRFNRYIEFDDYTIEQLIDIFKSKCKSEHYVPTDQLILDLKKYLNTIDLWGFANGRGIRNLFEKIITQQANRLLNEKNQGKNLSKEEFQTINERDLEEALQRR